MAKKTRPPTSGNDARSNRTRRGPSRPTASPQKARPPQADTLTLKQFKQFFAESISKSEGDNRFPCQQEALERRRTAAESGDLLALFSALQRCRMPTRPGFTFEDASLNPDLDASEPVCQIPYWLLMVTLQLVCNGLHGNWPAGAGRGARPATAALDRYRDLVRTAHVLKARDQGFKWKEAFQHVADSIECAGSARAVEQAYLRVTKAFKEDPTPYLFIPKFDKDKS